MLLYYLNYGACFFRWADIVQKNGYKLDRKLSQNITQNDT